MGRDNKAINLYSSLAVVGWSALLGLSLLWNLHQARDAAYSLARSAAVANIDKDLAFRRWATSHGGVYVPIDETTPPNPRLAVPNREIDGPDGTRLTLMNPAYMLRQLQETYSGGIGVSGHITSLRPLNPRNAPDPWEAGALALIDGGQDEVAEAADIGGKPYIRVIRAMRTEKGCLKCHASQGYKEGDVRGGISASVSLEPYLQNLQTENRALLGTHGGGWTFGILVIGFLHRRAKRRTLERRVAAEGLRAQEDRFRSVVETAQDAVVLADDKGFIVGWNPAAERIFGHDRDGVLGQPLTIIIPEELRARHMAALARAAGKTSSANSGQILNLPALHADGRRIPVEMTLASWREGGETVYGAVLRDVTERRQAEERQRLTANVFEFAHEGIVITDSSCRIVEVNATFLEITGYGRDEVIGQTPRLLKSGRHDAEFYDEIWRNIDKVGFWRGEIWNRRKNGEIYPELLTISAVHSPEGKTSHYVGTFADISQIKAQQTRLEMLAHYDPLTQLPNRVLMADRLSQAIAQTKRNGSLLVVGFLDLDGFKPINDTYGHALGDRLLIEVADRLKNFIRGGDTVARLGGDEFVFVFGGLDNLQECDRILNRLLTVIAAPYALDGHALTLSASIGVTLFPSDGADPDTLVRHADHAMYVAKQAGRNRYHMFDAEQDRQAHAHREAYARIEEALAKDELRLHYQPRVDMRHGKVVGFEALVRWQHPERGLLPPAEFLPVVDDSDLALPLGEWVIETALCQMTTWRQAGLETTVSVNIAARHLQCADFTDRLRGILARHPSDLAHRLEFEVLETVALENISAVAQVINECKGLGIAFALDDFGTGYSTLSYLKRLPAKTLKIDQTFVRTMLEDMEDLAIVEGVISLTRAFQRKVVAEGVESPAHGVVLLRLGCDIAQGFGIARPMSPDRVPDWLAAWTPDPSWRRPDTTALRREDFPLLAMELEHRNWVQRMIGVVRSPATEELPPLDADACRFGRWYKGPGQERYGHLPAFLALASVHERVHDLGHEVARLLEEGRGAEAAGRLRELTQARDDLLRRFDALKQAVIRLTGDSRHHSPNLPPAAPVH